MFEMYVIYDVLMFCIWFIYVCVCISNALRVKPPRALNLRQGGHEELKERLKNEI